MSSTAFAAAHTSGVPPKVVRAGREHVRAAFRRQHRADRHTAAQPLGHGDDVRADAVLLEAEQAARAADAGLHLVDDEQDILLAAVCLDLLNKFPVERQHAALALDELHHDRAGRFIRLAAHRVEIVCDCVVEALGEREKVVVEPILPGGLERGHRAPVEGVDERDDLVASLAVFIKGVFTRELDRALVRLRARVGKKHLAVQMGFFDQLLCHLHHRLGREQVGNVHQLVRLVGDGIHDHRVIVPQTVDANARAEVDVFFALYIPYGRALAVVERDRKTAVGIHHIFVFLGLEFLIGHFLRFFLTGTWCRRRL